jgi:hypothetical protein
LQPIDADAVFISEGGEDLGNAENVEVLDAGRRVSITFSGGLLEGLGVGTKEIEIHGCDAGRRAFFASGALSIIQGIMTVKWASEPGAMPVLLRLSGASGSTVIRIFNPAGLLVRADTVQRDGATYVWDGLSNSGRKVASGVYIVHAQGGGLAASCKVVVLH